MSAYLNPDGSPTTTPPPPGSWVDAKYDDKGLKSVVVYNGVPPSVIDSWPRP